MSDLANIEHLESDLRDAANKLCVNSKLTSRRNALPANATAGSYPTAKP